MIHDGRRFVDETGLGLPVLWSKQRGDARICIAVLDGPVDLTHPCFAGAQLEQIETLVAGRAGADPASQHGTHVASVLFSRQQKLIRGIAPGCRGLLVPIYSPQHGDMMACSQLDLARAINQAVIHGAQIINISGGELALGGEADPLLTQAIHRCAENGVLIVAAAGNDGCACLHVPAAVPSVLAVGAMNRNGLPLEFSNWGAAYQEQGVLAQGENILGAFPGGGVVAKSGTSFATPIVSGIVALLMSIQLKRGEKPDAQKVRAAILATAEPCDPQTGMDCRRLLVGRINPAAAYAHLTGETIDRLGGATDHNQQGGVAPSINTRTTPSNRYQQAMKKETNMSEQTQAIRSEINGTSAVAFADTFTADDFAQLSTDQTIGGNVAAFAASGFMENATSFPAAIGPSEVKAAACASCTNGHTKCASCAAEQAARPAVAYALGQIGYDFGTESRRDQFLQLANRNVHDPQQFLTYLQQDPASAASVIWTLSLDTTVVYAVTPAGPFANVAYERLREALTAQLTEGAERVSIPGYIKGSTRLLNGQQVPVLFPDLRGMYSWSTPALIKATLGEAPTDERAAAEYRYQAEGIQNFLERIYYEIRNLGMTPQERAMNYAATNAFQLEFIYKEAVLTNMKLDSITVERSPICRPGSECWDVKLTFFNPAKRLEQARHLHRFTVDVSEAIPVTVGKVRHWDIY